MSTPETKVTQAIFRMLRQKKAEGWSIFFAKLHGGPMQRAGLPDLLVIANGRAILLEIKSATGEATKLQIHTMGEISSAGGITAVVRSAEEAEEIVGLALGEAAWQETNSQ